MPTPPARPGLHCPNCGHELSTFDEPDPSRSERIAVSIAEQVGSWRFASAVILVIVIWVGLNVAWKPFEPYPVIVFAVISAGLASLAALYGPLILLTQRRAAERDRRRDQEVLLVAAHSEADLHRIERKLDEALGGTAGDPSGSAEP